MSGNRNQESKAIVKIFRFDPSKDKSPYYDEFEVPIDKIRRTSRSRATVLDVLKYIKSNYDAGLSFYASCLIPFYEAREKDRCTRGICNVFLNGKPVLTCEHVIEGLKELIIEPPSVDPSLGFEVIKDLIAEDVSIREKDYFFIAKKARFAILSELCLAFSTVRRRNESGRWVFP